MEHPDKADKIHPPGNDFARAPLSRLFQPDLGYRRMGEAEIYRKRAEECADLAAGSVSPQLKSIWLELAKQWLRLANEIELYGQTDPFVAFQRAATAGSGTRQ